MTPEKLTEMENLRQAANALSLLQSKMDDWYGPAGTKLSHAATYLREQYRPIEAAILSDPEVTA